MKSSHILSTLIVWSIAFSHPSEAAINSQNGTSLTLWSFAIIRLRENITVKAISLLERQFCKWEELKIEYSPLLNDIGFCKNSEGFPYALIPSHISECTELWNGNIVCEVAIDWRENFCIGINWKSHLLGMVKKRSCKK